jgi:hypothetical protein
MKITKKQIRRIIQEELLRELIPMNEQVGIPQLKHLQVEFVSQDNAYDQTEWEFKVDMILGDFKVKGAEVEVMSTGGSIEADDIAGKIGSRLADMWAENQVPEVDDEGPVYEAVEMHIDKALESIMPKVAGFEEALADANAAVYRYGEYSHSEY